MIQCWFSFLLLGLAASGPLLAHHSFAAEYDACPHMAKNTLEKIRNCLRVMSPEIGWAPEFDQAEAVIRRSLL